MIDDVEAALGGEYGDGFHCSLLSHVVGRPGGPIDNRPQVYNLPYKAGTVK